MTGPVAAVWYRDADTGAATVVLHEDGEDVTLAALDTETGSKGSLTVTGVQYADGRRIPRAEWTAFLDVLARRNARPRHEPPEDEPIGHVRDPFTGALAPIYWPEDHPDWLGDLLPSDASDGTTVADAPDLAEFLRQRLDEDEAAVRALENNARWPWVVVTSHPGVDSPAVRDEQGYDLGVCVDCGVRAEYEMGVAAHIARWDPARVLAEVKAKRAIVDMYVRHRDRRVELETSRAAGAKVDEAFIEQAKDFEHVSRMAVGDLVQPHADHPDFDPAWRTDA